MRSKSASTDLSCIVLAAGASKRLGQPKQLVRFRGKPLLARTARLAANAAPGAAVIVLGAGHLRLRLLLQREEPGLRVVRNSVWQTGLAGSLRCGIEALPRRTRAALVLLPDQAFVTTRDIDRLIDAWRTHTGKAAAATYAGRIGAPAIIPRRWFNAARSLQGDIGARHLLRALGDIRLVTMANAAFDVDTPEDLADL